MISLKHAKQFYSLWSSWLGDGGKPVDQPTAQARANTCLACPLNVEKGLTQLLAEGVASVVHRQMEIRHKLRLHVEGEEKLNICNGCECFLGLKVWVPMKHIRDNINTTILHPSCWILKQPQPPPSCS